MLPKNKKKIKIVARTILEIIGTGVFVSSILVAPGLTRLIDPRLYQTKSKRRGRINDAITKLGNQKYIEIVNHKGEDFVQVTDRGKQKLLKYQIDELKIKKPQNWDGVWRIVIFDIPEKKKIARDVLRYKLKELGFVMLQKSSWVYPYPCRDEIDFISGYYEIAPHVLYFEASQIPHLRELKRRFNFPIKKTF